jgi:hypothetical protein
MLLQQEYQEQNRKAEECMCKPSPWLPYNTVPTSLSICSYKHRNIELHRGRGSRGCMHWKGDWDYTRRRGDSRSAARYCKFILKTSIINKVGLPFTFYQVLLQNMAAVLHFCVTFTTERNRVCYKPWLLLILLFLRPWCIIIMQIGPYSIVHIALFITKLGTMCIKWWFSPFIFLFQVSTVGIYWTIPWWFHYMYT